MNQGRVGPALLRLLESSSASVTRHTAAKYAVCDMRTAERALKKLHTKRLIHIAGWDCLYNNPTPKYKGGNRLDVPRPIAPTPAERQRERRAKPGVREREIAARRAKKSIGKKVELGLFGI